MIRFGALLLLGLVIGSVSVSMFLFLDNLTVDVISESGERVKINDVEFDRVDANTLHVKFVTAWSPPHQIFEKLASDLKVAIDVHVGGEVDEEYDLVYGDSK